MSCTHCGPNVHRLLSICGSRGRSSPRPRPTIGPRSSSRPAFGFWRERCYFLVRANNYDARDGTLRWGAAAEAVRLGASVGGAADVVLADGTDGVVRRRAAHFRVGARRARGPPVRVGVVAVARRYRSRRQSGRELARTRSARGRAARGRPGPDPGARGFGQDHGVVGPVPAPGGRAGVRRTERVRTRVQPAGGRGDAGAARRPAARRAAQGPHAQLVRVRHRAPGPSQRAHDRRARDPQPDRAPPHAEVPRQQRRAPALPRSARRGAARVAHTRAGRDAAWRRRGLRRDVPEVPGEPRTRRRARLRRSDRRRDRDAAARAARFGPRCSASAGICSSTSSKTSAPRTSCSYASWPRPRTTCSASATTTR